MPQQLPQHKAFMLSDFGMRFRRVASPQDEDKPVAYSHQDDYYIIGLLNKGSGRAVVDFKECSFSAGDVFLILPGQVHRFISSDDAEGWLLFADGSFVENEEKRIFDKVQLFGLSSFKIDGWRKKELEQIASVLADRAKNLTDELEKATVRRLTETMVGIVAEAVRDIGLQEEKHSRRHVEILLSFRQLLDDRLAVSRQPSYYASQLNVSPVYLNEVVKEVTGMSATLYIKSEVVLRAKRLLVHTNLAVKEISNRLGISDHAYFSRLFTQATGISPAQFRRRNLE